MAKSEKPPQTLRQKKINSFLQQRIARIILEEKYSGITGLVTIKSVEVTADLSEAKVWFTALNQDPEAVLRILNKHLFEMQGTIFHEASMRVLPKLTFYIDRSDEYSSHINQLLNKINDRNE